MCLLLQALVMNHFHEWTADTSGDGPVVSCRLFVAAVLDWMLSISSSIRNNLVSFDWPFIDSYGLQPRPQGPSVDSSQVQHGERVLRLVEENGWRKASSRHCSFSVGASLISFALCLGSMLSHHCLIIFQRSQPFAFRSPYKKAVVVWRGRSFPSANGDQSEQATYTRQGTQDNLPRRRI